MPGRSPVILNGESFIMTGRRGKTCGTAVSFLGISMTTTFQGWLSRPKAYGWRVGTAYDEAWGNQWEKVAIPEEITTAPELLVFRDQLIVTSPGAVFLRTTGTWRKLVWPDKVLLRWALSDRGLFAAPLQDKPRLVIGSVEGQTGVVQRDEVAGQDIRTLVFDGLGRIWAGTDEALAVLDSRGHLLMQWPAGSLDGFAGSILDVAVVGAGPAVLPARRARRDWTVTGRFVTYKSRKPLSGATISLCSSGTSDCASALHAKRNTTNAQGEFRFLGISEGEFWIHVDPPVDTQECATPFIVTGASLVPARDCQEAAGALEVCDMGTMTTCLPFEMPPRPPH